MSALTTSIQHCTRSSHQGNWARKTNKWHQGWKVRMTIRANKGVQQSCRTNIQKSVVFQYNSSDQCKNEMKKAIPLIPIASKRIK